MSEDDMGSIVALILCWIYFCSEEERERYDNTSIKNATDVHVQSMSNLVCKIIIVNIATKLKYHPTILEINIIPNCIQW